MRLVAHTEEFFLLALCIQLTRADALPHGLCDTDKDCMKEVEYCEKSNETRGLCMCVPDHGLNSESSMCEKSKLSFDAFFIAGPDKVELPTKAVMLEVKFNRSGDETSGWSYAWELLLGTGLGYVEEYDKRQLVITELMPGRLRVLVKITNATMEGHASHTLSVSPRKVNISPKAVIKPPGPIFVLESQAEVALDGSTSLDFDGRIVKYQWAVRKGTPPKQLPPMNAPVVKIAGLAAGNNSIQLMVVDDKGSRDTAEVNVVVRKSAPPKAHIYRCGGGNGEATGVKTTDSSTTVRLPMQQLFLCGNSTASAVDEVAAGVLSYTWARVDNLHNLPLDYTGTTTPMLRLSNLHATNDKMGPYEFRLKVTDVKQQQSNIDLFSVHVKDRVLLPPEVSAGGNQTIVLPNNSAVLEGTVKTAASTDGGGKGVAYTLWELVSGPTASGGDARQKLRLINKDHPKASVTGLAEGLYQFRFNAAAEAGGATSSAVTFLNVVRGRDTHPVARAENATVTLPKNFAMLNGSASTDDTGIIAYKWRPLEYVPASLTILGDSANEPNLLLSNLIEGRYLFNLTVWDVAQKSHSTIAELLVRAGPAQENSVQLYLRRGVRTFSTRWRRKLADRLSAALAAQIMEADTVQINYTGVVEDPSNGYAVATFYATYVPLDEPQVESTSTFPIVGAAEQNSTLATVSASEPRPTNARPPTVPSADGGGNVQQPSPDYSATKRIVYAPRVVEILRREVVIMREFNVAEITTKYLDCFLDCTGHGTCSNYTKQCECEPFWMSNMFRRLQTGRREDCGAKGVQIHYAQTNPPDRQKLFRVVTAVASGKLNDWLFPMKVPMAKGRGAKSRSALKTPTKHSTTRRSTRRSHLFSPLAGRAGSTTSSGGGGSRRETTIPMPPASGVRVANVPGRFSPPPPTRGRGILASSTRKLAVSSSDQHHAGNFVDISINSTSGLDDTDDIIFTPLTQQLNKKHPPHAQAPAWQLHPTPETQQKALLSETYQSLGH